VEPLLVLLALLVSYAQEEALQQRPVALAKYLMLMQQLVYGIASLYAQLGRISIHLLHQAVHFALLVPQAMHVQEDLPLQFLVLRVKLLILEPLLVMHVLLALYAQEEALQQRPVALAKYLMLTQQVVYGMDRLFVQQERILIQLQQQPLLIALIARQIIFVQAALLRLLLVQRVNM